MKETRVAVISDSHGLIRPEVIRQVQDCDCVLHAGDIIREMDLDELAAYKPIYAVRGNCDTAPWASRLQGILRFELEGIRFLMVHDRRDAPRNLEDVDVIIHGHTHHYAEERAEGRLWLNPGSCGYPRFGTEVTMAILTIRGREIHPRRIDLPV